MVTGKNGTFLLSGTKGMSVRITWKETYDAVRNLSILELDAAIIKETYGGVFYLDGTISVGNETVVQMNIGAGSHSVSFFGSVTECEIHAETGYDAPPWATSEIEHNIDGSKSVTIAVNISGNYKDNTLPWSIGGSQTIALTHIPRASTIGATSANIGEVSLIAVNKKSSTYTHSISYAFGRLSGYVTADGGVSAAEVRMSNSNVAFTIPRSFYDQIPNAKTGTCTLTCKTYSGSTQIGDAQTALFVVTASEESCKPGVSGNVMDINEVTLALTGDAGTLVRFYSTALCTISAEPKNGASISQKKIGGSVVTGNTRQIAEIENAAVTFYALDSRGYTATQTLKLNMIPYVKLTCNPYGKRTDSTSGNAVVTLTGNYFSGNFGAIDNSLSIRYRYAPVGEEYGDYVELQPVINGDAYTAEAAINNLDYKLAYNVELEISDKLARIPKTVVIDQGIPVADWGKDDFRFNVPVLLTEKSFGKSLPTTGKYGQFFLLSNGDGTYSLYIHNGIAWS